MVRIFATILCALLLLVGVSPAAAVSISGIVLYATDDFGTPNGRSTYDDDLQAQLWRTGMGGLWHGLAVFQGLPPNCFASSPLNAPNFSVEIPLGEGENVFTLIGEPGPLTRTDEYERFAINIYFDGNTEAAPGLSGLFPKNTPFEGGGVIENRSDYVYTLSLQRVPGQHPPLIYNDGIDEVRVTVASFLPQERVDEHWNFDFVGPQSMKKSGTADFIGLLKLNVQPAPGLVNAGRAPKAIVPAGGTGSAGAGLPSGYGGVPAGYGGVPGTGDLPAAHGPGTGVGNGLDAASARSHPAAREMTTVRPTTAPESGEEHTPEAVTTPDTAPEPTADTTPPETSARTPEGTPSARTGTVHPAGTPTPGTPGPTVPATPGKTPRVSGLAGTATAAVAKLLGITTPTPGAHQRH